MRHIQLFFLLVLLPSLIDRAIAAPHENASQAAIRLSPEQQQLIGVTSEPVTKEALQKTIRATGRIEFDERRLSEVSLKVAGWVQDLFVDYTGKSIHKGEPLLTLYSPDLVTGQEEYLLALHTRAKLADSTLPEAVRGSHGLVDAARRRLLLWDLTPQQITALEKRGTPQTYLTLYAPVSGTVIEKEVVRGMRVEPGRRLFRIADLSTVWLTADLSESDLPVVREGQTVTVTLTSSPGETFHGKITYIYPYLDTQTRTNRIRLEFANREGKLKPGMYAESTVSVNLGTTLTVPASAVLQSGLRQLVFIDQGQGVFAPREVKLGMQADARFAVLAGLTEGERVVTSGNFLLDSESKLQSATSMMAMMGAIGMGDWKMESARPMDMGAQTAQAPPTAKKVGALNVTVSTAPEATKLGDNTLRIQVTDSSSKPVTDAAVHIEYTMDMPGMLIDKAGAKHTGAGVYEASVRFTMAGPWGVTVSLKRPEQSEARERFTLTVGQ